MRRPTNDTHFTKESFDKVYKANWAMLYNVARKFVDERQAEQLVENAFVELWFCKFKLSPNDAENRLLQLLKSSIYQHYKGSGYLTEITHQFSIAKSTVLTTTPPSSGY